MIITNEQLDQLVRVHARLRDNLLNTFESTIRPDITALRFLIEDIESENANYREPICWPFYTVTFDENGWAKFAGNEYCTWNIPAAIYPIGSTVIERFGARQGTIIGVRYDHKFDTYEYLWLQDSNHGPRPTTSYQLLLLPAEKENK